ncbi:Arabinose-proton symporter (Arabinose transporter) [Scheffersomyces stipitis CBS 6054]|uniref:Arabinose-proton symporter (Arabinose transporter) n=1 Tax=Scheffersomyces stipitis (strain ATCC 58785 / CBS 6054 / NBRC 10063 / NRRL Y-11545) TaxID=322104 RepID=A3LNF5_PICST|nr:Arabinose-proton symporter (Arabinose transporter) [Scheffersomyces stipitis CBS 6054]ABN64323.1 Arabinose-proton symporter (Arabinose transporter) [Scheffersomyces stipitis CBS 6054]
MSADEKVAAAGQDGLFEHNSSTSSIEDKKPSKSSDVDSVNSQLVDNSVEGNILSQYTESQVMQMGRSYATKHGLDPELFAKAAAVARTPLGFNSMPFLTEEEKVGLNAEATNKWHIPPRLIGVIALGSMAAAVQGMDESVINGANLFYPKAFGVDTMHNSDLIEGLINGAPYLCCGILSCWLSDACNRRLGRKWTIFWCCVISAITCVWQGLVNNWYHLFIARFFLGFGVGIKSATVPAYSAECTPKHIRGSLVMLWQFFTAVGIMFGYVASLAFYNVGDRGIHYGLNWRLMLGSAAIPAVIILFQIPFAPESPRWLMGKDRHLEAFESLKQLRYEELAAARDCFYQYVLLAEEGSYKIPTLTRFKEMFTKRRNRNGAIGAFIVMFMQQFCGINVIAYYSSSIFVQSGFSQTSALIASWGFGMLNFTFAIPAFFTIDRFGRRSLLLVTFPLMAIFLLIAGFGFLINEETNSKGRLGMIIIGIYMFTICYSSGEGPVPFTYSAEAFPLYIRDLGMSFATATCWTFNFILAFTWNRLVNAFTSTGAFGFYAAWNIIGFFLVLWFLPETKGLTLEELDEVFAVSAVQHAKYQTKSLINFIQRYVLRSKVAPLPPLYDHQRLAVTNPEWNDKPEVSYVE